MKVIYKEPSDSFKYKRWFDDNGVYDIWYSNITKLIEYNNTNIPNELKLFLNKWIKKIEEYKKTYREEYPARDCHIEFIYKDSIYDICPMTIKATYTSDFMSDEEYEVSWDSLFEKYHNEIIEDLKNELDVKHYRYFGYLD